MRYGIIVLDINTAIKPLNTGVKQGKAGEMDNKFKEYIRECTEAIVFYNKQRKSWCAYWLSKGHQNSIFFNKNVNKFDLVEKILKIQIEG